MTTLFLVVPLALLVSAGAVIAFVWTVRQGQLDDLETPAWRMLEDDRPGSPEPPACLGSTGSLEPRDREESDSPNGR